MAESSFLNPQQAVASAGIHEGMLVADFGASSGFFTRAVARAVGEAGVVWAVDCNQELLSRIKNLAMAEGLRNVEIIHGSPEHKGGTKLPPNHFDFCVVANLLFSTDDKAGLVSEVSRVLKRGGRALVIDWQGSFGGLGPSTGHVVSAAAARKLFEEGGFEYGSDVKAGEYHWGFVVRKKAPRSAQ